MGYNGKENPTFGTLNYSVILGGSINVCWAV